MKRTTFFKALLLEDGLPWIFALSTMVVAGVVCSFIWGLSAVFITLLVVFFFAPTLISFLYYYYALKPVTLLNTSPHSVSARGNEVEIRMTEPQRSVIIPGEELSKFNILAGGIVVRLKDYRKGWFWVPLSAFADEEEMNRFIAKLYNRA